MLQMCWSSFRRVIWEGRIIKRMMPLTSKCSVTFLSSCLFCASLTFTERWYWQLTVQTIYTTYRIPARALNFKTLKQTLNCFLLKNEKMVLKRLEFSQSWSSFWWKRIKSWWKLHLVTRCRPIETAETLFIVWFRMLKSQAMPVFVELAWHTLIECLQNQLSVLPTWVMCQLGASVLWALQPFLVVHIFWKLTYLLIYLFTVLAFLKTSLKTVLFRQAFSVSWPRLLI